MAGNKWLPLVLIAGIWLGALSTAPRTEAATLTPLSPTVVAGSSVSITLSDTISGADAIAGVDLQVTFASSLLALTSVTNGSLLVDYDAPYPFFSNGVISIQEDPNALNDPDGTGSVLTLTFTALSADPSISTKVTVQTSTQAKGVFEEYQLAPISTFINITAAPVIPPTTVPEPGTLVLVLAPMLAAACLKRRDRC